MTSRTRILALLLIASALVAYIVWPEEEEGSWAPNPNYRSRFSDVGAAASQAEAGRAAADSARRADSAMRASQDTMLDDAGLAQLLRDYGALFPLQDSPDTAADFHFVRLHDSTRTLESLGFIRAASLLDSTARFSAVGGSEPLSLRVSSVTRADTAFRRPGGGCVMGTPIPLERTAGRSEGRWTIGVAGGGGDVVPWHEARRTGGDTAIVSYTFSADATEFLVVATRRTPVLDTVIDGQKTTMPLIEQHVIISERSLAERGSSFHRVWSYDAVGDGDETPTEDPLAMLRLGRDRLLTLLTEGDYEDGGGGSFIARTAPGQWKLVASWYSGC